MEDGLREFTILNGRTDKGSVLILVLMEDGLREIKQHYG